MGWTFKWLSSGGTAFNYDFGVSFDDATLEGRKPVYNYGTISPEMPDREGMSVFYKDDQGQVFHTYSAYARGIDLMNTAYNYLDTVPKGRDEAPGIMYWLKRHDSY